MKSLTFIICGDEIDLEVPDHIPMIVALEWALDDARAHGTRKITDWNIRHNNGMLVANGDLSKSVMECGVISREVLFVTLDVGAGGAVCPLRICA